MEDPLAFATVGDWERWLEENHADSDGVWVAIGKQGRPVESMSSDEANEGAFCFGWISSHRKALDEDRFLQRFTPRRPRSNWSRISRETVERLDAEGRMRPAGLAEVELAKADGRWDAAYG